ncbi:hypothetical protein BJY14_007965 [Actinomadura luteofluorescens]|uniref:Uncharacterized protein n=1 Tax=Actinomadura luteofluorescens TaxID=46163 RepID=A0A7Y9JJY1_9ACTN|nr:hypothetical protein [Actinomadura luteofluorescens]NYD51982.1 hypothetical protein [Actinomadura luteofluorescens]
MLEDAIPEVLQAGRFIGILIQLQEHPFKLPFPLVDEFRLEPLQLRHADELLIQPLDGVRVGTEVVDNSAARTP